MYRNMQREKENDIDYLTGCNKILITPQIFALFHLVAKLPIEIPMHSTFCGATATGKLFNRAINQGGRW